MKILTNNNMIHFKTVIKKFNEQGEKTGWTYIEIPQEIANKIKPGYKKSFRVKGTLDQFYIERASLLPMGSGHFIIPLKASVRKALGKRKGEIIQVSLAEDEREIEINNTFLECLADEPVAIEFFNSLLRSHRNYFSKWIESAKTDATKEKRIAMAVSALAKKVGYGEMLRMNKNDKL